LKNSLSIHRAQGCLLGQLAGDALESLVEFQSPDEIRRSYPDGVRELADGGTWNTIASQPTDDFEMALLLARLLVKTGSYEPRTTVKKYLTVRQGGNSESKRSLDYCCLDMITPISGGRSSLSGPECTKAGGAGKWLIPANKN